MLFRSATCSRGQANEKENIGTCYADILSAIEQAKAEPVRWVGFDFHEQEEEGQECYVFLQFTPELLAKINQIFWAIDKLPGDHISSQFQLPTDTLAIVSANNENLEEVVVEEHEKQVGSGTFTVYTVDVANQKALAEHLQENRITPDREQIVITATECSLRAVIGTGEHAEDYLTADIPRTFFQT